jgi:hypothetical protein
MEVNVTVPVPEPAEAASTPVPTPLPVQSGKVELKVIASTATTLVAGVGGALLNALQDNSHLLGSMPGWAQFLIVAGAPPLLTFLAGYATPHTTR